MDDKQLIIDAIEKYKKYNNASSFGIVLLNYPDIFENIQSKGYDAGSTARLGRMDNSYYEGLDLYESINAIRGNAEFNLDYYRMIIIAEISYIGDILARNSYFDKSPLLEFLRHFRNGLSHGNKFNFSGKEPIRIAEFKNFKITKELQGQNILFDFIKLGDIYDVFDELKKYVQLLN